MIELTDREFKITKTKMLKALIENQDRWLCKQKYGKSMKEPKWNAISLTKQNETTTVMGRMSLIGLLVDLTKLRKESVSLKTN